MELNLRATKRPKSSDTGFSYNLVYHQRRAKYGLLAYPVVSIPYQTNEAYKRVVRAVLRILLH